MTANIPASLKGTDIGRFAVRAAQVERQKPVISYWCNYWIVHQIIRRNLHRSNDESERYTNMLMDNLEQFKTENAGNDAVIDDFAGQAYVEQFGLEIFNRADNAVRANKATKQTADTFLAAATFLEICQIWGTLDPDIASKIKYAKYHAVRITKAIKSGEDPNLSNPISETDTIGQALKLLDPDDPDVKALQHSDIPSVSQSQQPSIEEVPDESDHIERRLASQSILNESLHPSRSSSIPPKVPGARLFPPVDTVASSTGQTRVPEPPSMSVNLPLPHSFSATTIPSDTITQDSSTLLPRIPHNSLHPLATSANHPPPPTSYYRGFSQGSQPSVSPVSPHNIGHPPRAAAQIVSPTSTTRGIIPAQVVDDQSISSAQKHARWAVSALSFDDVETAIKELRTALRCLGSE